MSESVAKIAIPILVLVGGLLTGVMVAANARFKDAVQSPALTVALAFAIGSAVMFIVIANEQGNAALILAAGVVGQQLVALGLAHFGWLGTDKEPLNGYKIAGFVLLVVGALLIGKK